MPILLIVSKVCLKSKIWLQLCPLCTSLKCLIHLFSSIPKYVLFQIFFCFSTLTDMMQMKTLETSPPCTHTLPAGIPLLILGVIKLLHPWQCYSSWYMCLRLLFKIYQFNLLKLFCFKIIPSLALTPEGQFNWYF